jgi:hypothetical protein
MHLIKVAGVISFIVSALAFLYFVIRAAQTEALFENLPAALVCVNFLIASLVLLGVSRSKD